MVENCWYNKVCTQEDCTSNCVRYLEMKSLMDLSGLPKSKQYPKKITPDSCDHDNFVFLNNYKLDILNHVNNGDNLYIWSNITGNGKTTWAIKMLLKYFDCVWAGNGFKRRGVFIHVPTFLTQLKNFNDKNVEFETLKSQLNTIDLVVWDDIASTDMSSYDHSQLLTYIDQRILNDKANIFTGNRDGLSIRKALGERLASRVWNTSITIELKGDDKRNGSVTNY